MTTTTTNASAAATAATRADAAAVTTLLNCYLRETGAEVGDGGRLWLRRLGLELLAPLAYRSPTGQHRWLLPVRLARAGAGPEGPVATAPSAPAPLDHVTLATLLGKELALAGTDGGGALGELVAAVAESAARLRRLLPDLNRASGTVCDDHVADERFCYYLAINNLLGVVGALGGAGLADERDLLADLADHLRGAPRSPLVRTLLGAGRLRCKANLRTRLAGMDELVGPLASQSVYVEIDNPVLTQGSRA